MMYVGWCSQEKMAADARKLRLLWCPVLESCQRDKVPCLFVAGSCDVAAHGPQ